MNQEQLRQLHIDECEVKEAIHAGDYLDAVWFSCPRCPWCGAAVTDWRDSCGLRNDGDEVEINCGACEKPYTTVIAVEPPEFRSVRKAQP
jgi:hypothetical protein